MQIEQSKILSCLFSRPLSFKRVSVLVVGVCSVLSAGVLPFWLFLNGVLGFEGARYFGSFMFYGGLVSCIYIGLSTNFKRTWRIRRQLVTFGAFLFVLLATFAVVEAPLVNALTPLPTDKNHTNTTTGNQFAYTLSVPFTEYQWVVAEFRDGTYYAINGSDWNIMTIVEPWQAVAPWASASTNLTALVELCLDATTSGKILLNELNYPYALLGTLAENVSIVESCNGLVRQWIASENSQGSPYTISVDTVNPTYYLAQDSANRYIDSFASSNCTQLFQSVPQGCKWQLCKGIFDGRLSITQSNTIIKGAGKGLTNLTMATGVYLNNIEAVSVSNIEISDLTTNGNFANNPRQGGAPPDGNQALQNYKEFYQNGISIRNCSFVYIHDTEVLNSPYNGIMFYGTYKSTMENIFCNFTGWHGLECWADCVDCKIINNVVSNNNASGIVIENTVRNEVLGNTVFGTTDPSVTVGGGTDGIQIHSGSAATPYGYNTIAHNNLLNASIVVTLQGANSIITENTIVNSTGTLGASIMIASDVSNGNITIANNIVKSRQGTQVGIAISCPAGGYTVSGNKLIGEGILVSAGGNGTSIIGNSIEDSLCTYAAIMINNALSNNGTIVNNNNIFGGNCSGIQSQGVFTIAEGNSIFDAGAHGIYLLGNYGNLHGNTIVKPQRSGIYLSGNYTHVADNGIDSANRAAGSNWMITLNGGSGAACDGNQIQNNRLSNTYASSLGAGIYLNSYVLNTTVIGNNVQIATGSIYIGAATDVGTIVSHNVMLTYVDNGAGTIALDNIIAGVLVP